MQLEYLIVTRPETAEFLVEHKTSRLLVPFMKRELSLTAAAHELAVKLSTLHHHAKRFIDAGLLEVARTERRAGRPIKYYRSTSKTFFVPFHVTHSETLERLITEVTAAGNVRFYREVTRTLQQISPTWGLHVFCSGEKISFSFTPDEKVEFGTLVEALRGPGAPAAISTEGEMKFDYETAKAFQNDLFELAKRYEEKQLLDGQPYAYRLGLTPIQDGG